MSLIEKYKELPDHVWLRLYRRRVPRLVERMRGKERIRVLFVLHCLDKWKTEGLYRLMLEHERFEPVLGLAMALQDYPSEAFNKFNILKSYVTEKGYDYVELCQKSDLDRLSPDIIFYIEPYNGVVNRGLEFRNARNALFCYSAYGIISIDFAWTYSTIFFHFLWQEYFGSPLSARNVLKNCPKRKVNICYTGIPFADSLTAPAEGDPWKPQPVKKKRIIYAPHHSIVKPQDPNNLYCGTFLQFGEDMLRLARKYQAKVQWAFKPHPCLFRELSKQWGEQRTREYYNQWAEMENTQFEEGSYLDLFKHSDAMIHDSSSFICEYLFMNKPVLYLDNGYDVPLNDLGRAALSQHYHADTIDRIEQFIKDTVSGNDPMNATRSTFAATNLLPPNGKTAAENIIDAILGN